MYYITSDLHVSIKNVHFLAPGLSQVALRKPLLGGKGKLGYVGVFATREGSRNKRYTENQFFRVRCNGLGLLESFDIHLSYGGILCFFPKFPQSSLAHPREWLRSQMTSQMTSFVLFT